MTRLALILAAGLVGWCARELTRPRTVPVRSGQPRYVYDDRLNNVRLNVQMVGGTDYGDDAA